MLFYFKVEGQPKIMQAMLRQLEKNQFKELLVGLEIYQVEK